MVEESHGVHGRLSSRESIVKGWNRSFILEGRCEIDDAVTDVAVETWFERDAGRRLEIAEK